MTTGKTGHFVNYFRINGDPMDEVAIGNYKKLLRQQMGDKLIQLHDDGRKYVVNYSWEINNSSGSPSPRIYIHVDVLLADPRVAEINEYVMLGAVDSYLDEGAFKAFIYLGPEFLFIKDDFGWYRAALSEAERLNIRNEVREKQNEE